MCGTGQVREEHRRRTVASPWDMTRLTGDLASRMVDGVEAAHYNAEHPRVHTALRALSFGSDQTPATMATVA
jgi:hypothetical protein